VEDGTHIYAAWAQGIAKYNEATKAWDICTGPVLTGSNDKLFSWDTSQNSVVFSRGKDQVMRVPFNLTYAILNANCPPALYLCRFADRLFLGSTVEGGTTRGFRVRRCVANDHTDWVGVGSGFHDLTETPHQVRAMKKLGTRLAVYTIRNVHIGTRTGIPGAPVGFEPALLGVGMLSGHTLKDIDELHVFLSNHGFMQFNGSQIAAIDLQLGDAIASTFNASGIDRNFSEVMFDSHEYVTFLCTGASPQPDTAWVYHWSRQAWYPWQVDGPTCSTVHRLDFSPTIDSLIGTIDEQNWEFDSRVMQKTYPAMLTGDKDGKVYQWSAQYSSDAGRPIFTRWTSRDFTGDDLGQQSLAQVSMAGQQITLKRLEFDYLSGSPFTLNFYFSTNGGVTWDGPHPVVRPGESGGLLTGDLPYQVTGNKIRFKFEHTSATESWQIAKFTLWFERKGMIRN